MSGRWIRAIAAAEIPPGRGKPVRVDDRWVAIFHDRDGFLALDDACPHQGASLGEGTLHGGTVICPWHGWVFDAGTGECRGVPGARARCYPARVSDGFVEIEMTEAAEPPRGDGA